MLVVRSLVPGIAFRAEIPQHPLGDVLDVRRPLAQIGVRDPAHRFEEILHHRVKRVFGVLQAVGDGVQHPVHHRAVLEDHDVRLEDPALVVAG